MTLFMSKYSKNIDFFVLIKKIFFDVFWAFYNALEIFVIFLIFFFHNFLSLYVVMMLFMSKYSKIIDFFVLIKKKNFDVFWAFYNALEIFAFVFNFFFHNILSLYVVMMLFMSKYSKNIDFFVLIKKIFLMFFGRFTML